MSFNQVSCSLWKACLNLFCNMKTSMRLPEDIEKINKFTSYQLPNKFKIVGLVLFITSLIAVLVIAIYLRNSEYNNLSKRIASTLAIAGLLMIAVSREKIEDELIAKIRMQSYHYAVVGTVIFYGILPFIDFAFESISSSLPKIQGSADVSILLTLLVIQILTFRKLKKAYNEE